MTPSELVQRAERNVSRSCDKIRRNVIRAYYLDPSDLRSHELPRNSGEVAAVHGPTTLGEKPEASERA